MTHSVVFAHVKPNWRLAGFPLCHESLCLFHYLFTYLI